MAGSFLIMLNPYFEKRMRPRDLKLLRGLADNIYHYVIFCIT